MKKPIPPKTMFIFGCIAFLAVALIIAGFKLEFKSAGFWVCRVLIALAAAAISISIPGMLKVNYIAKNDDDDAETTYTKVNDFSLLDKEPTVTASGAIAVFILVYLFNPLN